jgi:hypothetical protein
MVVVFLLVVIVLPLSARRIRRLLNVLKPYTRRSHRSVSFAMSLGFAGRGQRTPSVGAAISKGSRRRDVGKIVHVAFRDSLWLRFSSGQREGYVLSTNWKTLPPRMDSPEQEGKRKSWKVNRVFRGTLSGRHGRNTRIFWTEMVPTVTSSWFALS